MTTRRGERIEERREMVADILRPLAEATVPCSQCDGTGKKELLGHSTVPGSNTERGTTLAYCPPTVPDPRFNALRRPIVVSDYVSGPGIRGVQVEGRTWTLDASLGAIIEAAAAWGIYPLRIVLEAIEAVYNEAVFGSFFEGAKIPQERFQKAAARALVDAWRD